MADCNTPDFGLGAYNIVVERIDTMTSKADNAYATALNALEQIQQNTGPAHGVSTAANFAADFTSYTPFTKPQPPGTPVLEYQVGSGLPGDPLLTEAATELVVGDAPDDDLGSVAIAFPDRPVLPTLVVPGDAPTVTTPLIPEPLTLLFPGRSALLPLTLPDLPIIDLQALRDELANIRNELPEIPEALELLLNVDLEGDVHAQYNILRERFDDFLGDRALLDEINSTIINMFNGLSGIAPAVEQDMYNRAAERTAREAATQERAAYRNWHALGFSLPNTALVTALDRANEERRSALRDLNRDIRIEAQKVQIEQVRFATEQAIQLRNQIRNDFSQLYEHSRGIVALSLQGQQFIAETQLALFRERVTAWRALLETLQQSLQIEEFALRKHEAELGNQRLISDINAQTIAQDTALVEQEKVRVEARKEEINAIRAVIEAELAKLQGFEQEVRIVEAQARVQGEQVNAYRAAVDAEGSKIQVLDARARVLESRTRAYQTRVDAADRVEQYKLRLNEQRLAVFDKLLTRYSTEHSAEAQRLNSAVNVFQGQATLYSAELQAESARAQADTRIHELTLEEGRTQAQLELAKEGLEQRQIQHEENLNLQRMIEVGRIASQVASGALTAISTSAGYNYSGSESANYGCTTSYTYSGDA